MALSGVHQSEWILSLSGKDSTLARGGGKGMNLAELTRAGFDVPPGFIVATDAYRAFVRENNLGAWLLDIAQTVQAGDPTALEAASEKIREAFAHAAISAEISQAIRAAYAGLPGGDLAPVAVRSSATAEDLPGLSFAGQQDTYLNIIGPDALIEAVKSCWASLWTARAIGYRARNRISPEDVALAVVVQQMIPSEVSGVLFTANPLTGNRGETVIDASYGLGEAIVSGQVEPDHYVVNQRTMQITTRRLGAKALAILPRSTGGTESITKDRPNEQALSDAQILELARTTGRVAEHFGSPQDIEWAVAGGHLYLLQSRPITSLYPMPDSLLRSEKLRVLFSVNGLQGFVDPFTPFGLNIFPLIITGIMRAAAYRGDTHNIAVAAGLRLYGDFTGLLTSRRMQRAASALIANADPGARATVETLIASGRIPTTDSISRVRLLRFAWGFRGVITRMFLTVLRPEARRDWAVRTANDYVTHLQKSFQQADSLAARLEAIDHYGPTMLVVGVFNSVVPAMGPGLIAQGIVDRWLHSWLGTEPGTVRLLLRGLPDNPTTIMDVKLWQTAQAIRSDADSKAAFLNQPADVTADMFRRGQLPAIGQKALQGFLDEYGMRAIGEIDVGLPRWREDPRSIIQNLASYLQIEDPELAPDRVFQKAGAESERLAAEFVAQVRQKKGGLRARMLAGVIRRMRLLTGLRELPKFEMIRMFDTFRAAMMASGNDLASQGKLDKAEDIFFIPLDTLRAFAQGQAMELKAIVQQGRADYEREKSRREIPRILLSTGEAFYAGMTEAGTDDLVGEGVSPGTVEGTVRVILDPRGARLEHGEILVCPATDPGWTPLFLSAGGLVMELGGMITHGSVVAREYGIPAVVGVHEVTTRLKTGQRVRVDGSAGRVVVLDEDSQNGG